MSCRTHPWVPLRVSTYSWLFAVLWLWVCPCPGIAQMPEPDASSVVQHDADEAELATLTEAQQKARQLATALIGQQARSTTSLQSTSIEVLTDQTQRLHLTLFTSSHLEGRLRGGQRTLVSPVDYAPSSDPKDARRPLFIPAALEAIMALELLSK